MIAITSKCWLVEMLKCENVTNDYKWLWSLKKFLRSYVYKRRSWSVPGPKSPHPLRRRCCRRRCRCCCRCRRRCRRCCRCCCRCRRCCRRHRCCRRRRCCRQAVTAVNASTATTATTATTASTTSKTICDMRYTVQQSSYCN